MVAGRGKPLRFTIVVGGLNPDGLAVIGVSLAVALVLVLGPATTLFAALIIFLLLFGVVVVVGFEFNGLYE